ncbi:hypothetical protein N7457_000957 [Penicillium paradoxum]|uniref:uncharacterized protein n=1 Tax=Penicillium paradoxum TaxID=176176 RepID=UPI0025480174|nr:uncharacterized protein N7457_000957 [Penicillium paradoxum]KAJ5794358.1 hypothetical protein N7457_000957 [Penicillium paradoxum]
MTQGRVVIVGQESTWEVYPPPRIAVKLSQGYKFTVIARELPSDVDIDYASPWAGAHFRPTAAKTQEERWEQRLMRETYKELEGIAKHYPEVGVDFVPAVDYFDAANATTLPTEENGYTTRPDFRILESWEYPPKHAMIQIWVTYRSRVVNSPIYLKWLQMRAEEKEVHFIRAQLTDLQQAVSVYQENRAQGDTENAMAIVDASGRGFNDPVSFPSRGQFSIASNQCDKTISHHWSDESSTVIIPRPLGGGIVIGGTK